MKKVIIKTIFVLILLIYAVFNIVYIINVKGNIECFGASMLLKSISNKYDSTLNLIFFLVFIVGLIVTYLITVILEKREASSKEIKKTFIYIAIVSIISGIILPNNSSDIYYYQAVGRLNSKYGINMYEEEFSKYQEEYKEDKVISASPAISHKFIYGPVWALVCKIIGRVDTNSALWSLYLFKILNIIVHILNCYLIWKISKNKKLVLLYGLNPLMIFEGIINVHNDIYLILFSLLAIKLKKENQIGLAVLSIAIRSTY